MPAAETPFELTGLALEATKGTPVTPPTHLLNVAGLITPIRTKYRPEESRGTTEEHYRAKTVSTGSSWEIPDSLLDPNYAPVLFNMIAKAVTSPTTPGGATNARLFTFTPSITSDDLKAATLYSGDPNVQTFQSAYCMADTLTVKADATSDTAAMFTMKGMGRFPAKVAAPTFPAAIPGELLMPGAMQLWIDTSSAIGTTEVTGRFIKTDWSIPSGVSYKRYANGPAGGLNFTKHGRGKRHAEATIEVELNDVSLAAEYATWEADTICKVRIRLNGPLIEAALYHYVELDIYGPLDAFAWGTVSETNRTMIFQVLSQVDATLGASFSLKVQSIRTAL